MNLTTKHIAIFALTYSLLLVALYGIGLRTVQSQIVELNDMREAAAEQIVKESAYNTLLATLDSSADARAELTSRFLTQRDTVTFVTEVEEEAARRGIEIETTNLALTEGGEEGFDTLLVAFSLSGQEAEVKNFLLLLELLPYHKYISNINVQQQAATANWRASISIVFTLLP